MAEQRRKSQAEKVASTPKGKSAQSGKGSRSGNKGQQKNEGERKLPVRLITSVTFLALFILFLVIHLRSEGALVKLLASFIQGLIGKVGFVVLTPVMLWLFIIHAFTGKRPVVMRSICLGCFTLLCGCISHLALNPQNLPGGIEVLGALYKGGIEVTTGGVLCGGLAMLVKWLCGTVISYIIFIIAAVLTLLGGMQITIPGIIRAVQNLPKEEKEPEEEERQNPAAVVVNHIASKRQEYKENRRRAAENEAENDPEGRNKRDKARVNDFFRQIDGDVEEPVSAAKGKSNPSEELQECDPMEGTAGAAPEEPASAPVEETAQESPTPAEPVPEPKMPVQKPEPRPTPAPTKMSEKVTEQEALDAEAEIASEIAKGEVGEKPEYHFPPITLLSQPRSGTADGTVEMRENTRRLNEALASFKIEAHIINVTRGPSVTRYEVELEKGVRMNKLTSSADDIALSLGAVGVRIAPIPGRISVVGIEVPNRTVTMVSLREVIDSQQFFKAKSKSSFAVGKDISGACIVGNIARLPHMLIAGTTGSGKSVCMNSLIISLLYKATPDEVKLIMIDPKMVELGIYNGIPHLLIPVVTDPKKAAGSLQWAVTEMMRRYKAMSDMGVRDMESYNSIVESQKVEAAKLPQVVVIIDELADLMLVAAKEVEESICRIAQMGRAAGIHLVIATQRPSADVITGLMKANIPSRIAFSVASAMESRIILDTQGAEKLVGKGDMLYAPIGDGKPQRVQGCYVSDAEVEAVATYVKSNYTTSYDQQVIEEIERKAVQTGNKTEAPEPEPTADEMAGDEMLPAAVDVILETGQASVSMLQRRLKLGYARAARIVDEMEEKGIVGPFQGSKPRAILITKEQWQQMRSGQGSQMNFDDLETDEPYGDDTE